MEKKQILDYVRKHPFGKVKLAITDIDGVLRGNICRQKNFFLL